MRGEAEVYPLYDHIGQMYDLTRKADPEIVRRLRYLLQVKDSARILDVACGTGNYTVALADTGLRMMGIDLSSVMIDQARSKSVEVDWQQADVTNLPISDTIFEGVTCILAIHHFNELI